MKNTVNQKLVALCSAAVLTAASFAMQTGVGNAFAKSKPVTNAKHVVKKKVTGVKKPTSIKPSGKKKVVTKPKKVLSAAQKAAMGQKYKDGSYTGVGQTQIGAVQVVVTLKKDKITNVQITGYSTHYPISYIDPILPQELLQYQDINKINIVTGATLSTADFYYGVVQALGEAQTAQKQFVATLKKSLA